MQTEGAVLGCLRKGPGRKEAWRFTRTEAKETGSGQRSSRHGKHRVKVGPGRLPNWVRGNKEEYRLQQVITWEYQRGTVRYL